MKIFELSLAGYELYKPILYYNSNKTNDEFNADVSSALNDFVDNITLETYAVDMTTIHRTISEKLFTMGYERLETYAITFNYDAYLENDLKYFLDTEGCCNVIKSMLSIEKLEKLFDHNNRIYRNHLIEDLKDITYCMYESKLNAFNTYCKNFNLNHKEVYNNLSDDQRIALWNANTDEFKKLLHSYIRKSTGFKDINGHILYEKDWILFIDENKYSDKPVCIKWNENEMEFDAYNPDCCPTCKDGVGAISSLEYAITIGGKFKIVKQMKDEKIIVKKSPIEFKSTRIDIEINTFLGNEVDSTSELYFIIIAPGLNMSGYGDSVEEAEEMFNIVFEDYCEVLSNLSLNELIEEFNKYGFVKTDDLIFTKDKSTIDIADMWVGSDVSNFSHHYINIYHITTDSLMF